MIRVSNTLSVHLRCNFNLVTSICEHLTMFALLCCVKKFVRSRYYIACGAGQEGHMETPYVCRPLGLAWALKYGASWDYSFNIWNGLHCKCSVIDLDFTNIWYNRMKHHAGEWLYYMWISTYIVLWWHVHILHMSYGVVSATPTKW